MDRGRMLRFVRVNNNFSDTLLRQSPFYRLRPDPKRSVNE